MRITTCSNIIVKQHALRIGYKVENYICLRSFKDNGQFKILQDFSYALIRKSNWLCENKILKTVIFRKLLRFNMTCCSFLQNILKLYFTNGVQCILDKKLIFYDNLMYKKN